MKTKRELTISTLAALCLAIDAYSAPWSVREHTDDITDELSYLVVQPASDAIEIMPLVTYRPAIVLQVVPNGFTPTGGMTYKADAILKIDSEGLVRSGTDVTIRFDKDPPTTAHWESSTDRRAAFHPKPSSFISNLLSHTNLIVRYATTLGDIRTSKFDITELQSALQKVKALYSKQKPPDAIAIAPSKEKNPEPRITFSICKKCKGNGEIAVIEKCAKCFGRGRIYTNGKWTQCPKTITTQRKKKCPECNGIGTIEHK